ncbi:hypothetical protein OS11_42270 [Dickeya oryzae]
MKVKRKKRGWWVKVETRGSVGAGNPISQEEVEQADLVIVAADIEVDLSKFAGKKNVSHLDRSGIEEDGARV